MKQTRILVVEDEFIIAQDLQTTLQNMGYDVPVTLSSGDGIIEKVKEVQPDLVLMDINLEGSVDGIEAAGLLKDHLHLPVLYLTSYTDEKTLDRAKKTEPYGYIVKPFNQRELKTTIEMAVYKAKMERKLKENERWLSTLLRSMTDGVVSVNRSGEITYMNPVAENLCGNKLEEVQGRVIHEVFRLKSEINGAMIKSPCSEVVDLNTPVRLGDLVLLSRSGEEIPVDDTWLPLHDSQGGTAGAMFICRDSRERRRAEAKRKELEAQILHVQKLESLGVLAGGIAHDFNNLLCIILGNASLALGDVLPIEKVREKIRLIETTAQRATDVVRQILSYAGKNQAQKQVVNLSHVIGEMGTLLETSISKKVQIEYDFGKEIPSLFADVAQLQQVIMNLIINASDAIGDKRGVIKVTTGIVNADQDLLAQCLLGHELEPGKYALLQVVDNGSGMDAKTKAKIFDPFFTTKFTGRGLGLAVVLGIIKMHDGAVFVESELHKGTTFRVLFPVKERAKDIGLPKDEGLSKEAPVNYAGTVLVVDDEGNILTVVREILENRGFQVLTANSGTEGIEVFKKRSSEIVAVLLDMAMPDMDGSEALVQMRKVRSDVKVVLTSGYDQENIAARLEENAVSHFIQKPYMPDVLVQKIVQAIKAAELPQSK